MRITLSKISTDGRTTRSREREVDLPDGATVEEALDAFNRTLREDEGISIFAKRAELLDVLHDGDRLEIAPPILVDPREARRRRAERQGDVRVVTCGRHGGRHRLEKDI
ncbi:RnfH family protein [Sutterella sp.]|uniref:RnfH family protein n=1 Tax=Sutterella sp. TaxID=1981025 RepID=UPI0025FEB5F1|nr:RnfH family protein [uncultured Sutterella sp.]